MTDLPEIPDEAVLAADAAAVDMGASTTTPDLLHAAWPHLYAAALRHAAHELDEAARTILAGGGMTNGLVAEGVGIGAVRLRARADEAATPESREGGAHVQEHPLP